VAAAPRWSPRTSRISDRSGQGPTPANGGGCQIRLGLQGPSSRRLRA